MNADELDALEAATRQAHSIVVLPRDTMMLSTRKLLDLIADLRRAQECIEALRKHMTEEAKHGLVYDEWESGHLAACETALDIIATYDEGASDDK